MTLAQVEMDNLETLVDRYGIGLVVEALADICGEKAEHLQVNWQDINGSKKWERCASRLYRAREAL